MKLSKVVGMLVVIALAGTVQAALVVDLVETDTWVNSRTSSPRTWSGQTTGDYDGDGDADDSKDVIPFDETVYITPDTGYQSSDFYGGVSITHFGGNVNAKRVAVNDGTPDTWVIGANSAGPWSYDIIASLVWLEDDFLTSGRSIASDDALAVTMKDATAGNDPSALHWLVKVDGSYYVSVEEHDVNGFAGEITSTSLTTTQWKPVDLTSSIEATPGTAQNLDLSDVEGVGVYTTGNRRNFSITAFSANMVPEPATMGILGLGVIGLIKRRR